MAGKKLSQEERERRRREQRERLAQATEELLTSDGWRRWLRTRATFRRYSYDNTLLIALQANARGFTPTHVAGFRAWLTLGRCVRKGEQGLRIAAPMAVKERDRDGEETGERRMLFREAAVFDVSQTEPLPGSEPAPLSPPGTEPLAGDSHAGLIPVLESFAGEIGYPVSYAEDLGRALGLCDRARRTITLRGAMLPNKTVEVLIHELGHALLGGMREDSGERFSHEAEELIVESVAYVVSASAGLDVGCEAVPYVASYGGLDSVEKLERAATMVDALARRIEDALAVGEQEARTA